MTFEEFLPDYLAAHSDRRTQIVHASATLAGVSLAAVAALKRKPSWLLAALAIGYIPAWLSHWLIERNQPKTFKYPLLSLRGDFVMASRLLRGDLPSSASAAPE
ncbi:MAG TPA: DUF962 domain-containing protein [Candidatus Baltobacteraceae bacterium]|nr:DUF962 domain-containing protein [Candidatus Baltobacteraceae bacterium]